VGFFLRRPTSLLFFDHLFEQLLGRGLRSFFYLRSLIKKPRHFKKFPSTGSKRACQRNIFGPPFLIPPGPPPGVPPPPLGSSRSNPLLPLPQPGGPAPRPDGGFLVGRSRNWHAPGRRGPAATPPVKSTFDRRRDVKSTPRDPLHQFLFFISILNFYTFAPSFTVTKPRDRDFAFLYPSDTKRQIPIPNPPDSVCHSLS